MISFRTLGSIDLLGPDGRETRTVLRQPKRVALLAYLAGAPRRFHRRDTLVALFWPELDETHARGALRQSVRFLRRSLGDSAVISRGDEEIALGDEIVPDAAEFERAVQERRFVEAVTSYHGDFLAGFHISNAAPEFDQWVDAERVRLRTLAAHAAWELAAEHERKGERGVAVHWAQRAVSFSPNDESALRRLIALLDRCGERAAAILAYEDFARQLATEFDAEPAAETKALVESIREARHAMPQRPTSPSLPTTHQPNTSSLAAGPNRRRWRQAVGWAVPVIALIATVLGIAIASGRRHQPPVLAVGAIRDHTGADSLKVGSSVADLLATNLSRLSGVQVVSTARMYELLSQFLVSADTSAAIARAAREAGAAELLEGALYRQQRGSLRLDVRRVDLKTGSVRSAYTVSGADAFALVDRLTLELAAALNLRTRPLTVADVTTSSLVAHRFYEEGLRSFYDDDPRVAHRLFLAALEADSLFAMATYYAGLAEMAMANEPVGRLRLMKAARLAERTTERERLIIRARVALEAHDPKGIAAAETLAVRFPNEPDAHYLLGLMLTQRGDFHRAITHLQRVIAMDSSALRTGAPNCRSCDAVGHIANAYMLADSLRAAEQLARRTIGLRPGWLGPLFILISTLERQNRIEEAAAAINLIPARLVTADAEVQNRWSFAVRSGDFQQADRIVTEVLNKGARQRHPPALWLLTTSLRYQGRHAEALAAARRMRALVTEETGQRVPIEALVEAHVLFELGRAREAAELFDSIRLAHRDPVFESRTARHHAWTLTHRATALAAAGDTALLASLADSIERIGERSSYGRDPLLHHHARGLLWRARGRPNEAESEFRKAIYSTTMGYTRTNYELGRLLVAMNRPRDAIEMVAPALRGPLDASNLYITHTELHEVLGDAYHQLGIQDSAGIHYRYVVKAWRGADPPLRGRWQRAYERLGTPR